jgi:hypothetical protein
MKEKNKIILFVGLVISMLFYISWVFYISEPQYIDNINKPIERYDYVTLPKPQYSWEGTKRETVNGIVLQTNGIKALVKTKEWCEIFYELDLKTSDYRIIGKGTIYHKVNDFVGFNIMAITQIFVAILCVAIGFTFFITLFKIS